MSKWILEKDKLPEPYEDVLTLRKGGNYCIEQVQNVCGHYFWECDLLCDDIGEVTHWMPLPEPPTDK